MMQPALDPLLRQEHADRLHYATGALLGADDFRDEQTYHRRQLARALLFLHGSGTVAGLRVAARHQPAGPGGQDEVELEVEPGLALDWAGRLIEVPRAACLRLRRWYEHLASQPPGSAGTSVDHLRAAFHDGAVVADVFLAFHPCDRGYTPAFASGPFDALDASQPSRVRDGYELSLSLRTETDNPDDDPERNAAFDPWAQITGGNPAERLESAQAISLDLWQTLALRGGAWRGNPVGVDPTAVLLARVRIPAGPPPGNASQPPPPDWSADTWPEANANVRNGIRNVILPAAALRRVAGA